MHFKGAHKRHICEYSLVSRVCVHDTRVSVPTVQRSASGNVAENPLKSSMTLKIYRKFGELLFRKRTVELNAVMARTKT